MDEHDPRGCAGSGPQRKRLHSAKGCHPTLKTDRDPQYTPQLCYEGDISGAVVSGKFFVFQ